MSKLDWLFEEACHCLNEQEMILFHEMIGDYVRMCQEFNVMTTPSSEDEVVEPTPEDEQLTVNHKSGGYSN